MGGSNCNQWIIELKIFQKYVELNSNIDKTYKKYLGAS